MNAAIQNTRKNIEKERISSLNFPTDDVLKTKKEREHRAKLLKRALRLGNLEKHKVNIDFMDVAGIKRVQTTIWSLTERFAILKSNTRIPINRILEVSI